LADAGVDVVKIKELMGHASIVTTMRYIHATDQGKRGAITVLSEYRQQRRLKAGHKLVAKKNGRFFNLPQVIENNGEPWRARTSDPLIKSQLLYQLS
jgi:integrase